MSRWHEGRDVGARKVDSIVWSHRQLYVVSQANASIHGFSNYATAKNALSVGSTMDGGHLAASSSRGPTADGRLSPRLVATGVRVNSARGDGSRGGYRVLSGTSMAAPTVAGVGGTAARGCSGALRTGPGSGPSHGECDPPGCLVR